MTESYAIFYTIVPMKYGWSTLPTQPNHTLGGIVSICFRFHYQYTLRMHTQGCHGCQMTRNL